jgi:DNA-binding Lrp family transcriptional regulator
MSASSESAWLTAVQRDIPLVRKPFAEIGQRFDMSEDQVMSKIKALFDEGKARRVGAVFDVRGVGYQSALCAARIPEAELEQRTAELILQPGMTHCYQRGWPADQDLNIPEAPPADLPSLWFTIAAPHSLFDAKIVELRSLLSPAPLYVLPAIRHFKIDVVFQTDALNQQSASEVAETPKRPDVDTYLSKTFTAADHALVRAMQGLISLTPCPYDEIAETLGRAPDEMLETLRVWKAAGVLRRVGVILRHRKVGFSANGMCVWRATPEDIEAAGETLAGFRAVTHCYEREMIPGFPYNLFAMIHAGSYDAALEQYRVLSKATGLREGCVLFSVREFKKTSPRYFCEE